MDDSTLTLSTLLSELNYHLIGHSCDKQSIVKVNSHNLSKNGELSFQSNLKAWKCFDHKLDCDQECENILEHSLYVQKELSDDKNLTHIIEKFFKILILKSKNWIIEIEKYSLKNEIACLFLNRQQLIPKIIKSAIFNGSKFGIQSSTHTVFNLKYSTNEESELTTARLRMMENFTSKILKLQGHKIGNDSLAQKILFTSRSEGKIDDNYERYVCGVVKNFKTHAKETSLTWDSYTNYKVQELIQFNDHENITRSQIIQISEAVVTFELLSVKPSRSVFVRCDSNVDKGVTNSKGACFALYNAARISSILESYSRKVSLEEFPCLPDIEDVNFTHLIEEDEWELVFNFIFGYSELIRKSVKFNSDFKISPHSICSFLSQMCQRFSIYYRKTRILTEPREHLVGKMFARLYLLKALKVIFENTLSLLDIKTLSQM